MRLEVFHCQSSPKGSRRTPILFIHGSYCSAWIWNERFMPYFASRGFACHALSLRGHGGSEGMLSWASLSDYVDDVASVVEEIGTPPILVGHSMGGLIAQHYVADRHAAATVLLAAVPPSGSASSAMHLSMFAPDVLWQLGLLQSLGPQAVSPDVFHRAFFTAATAGETVRHMLPKLQSESHRISAELLAPRQPIPPNGKARPPMLVVGGDADVFLPVSAFRETATYFRADLELLHGAPHGLMLDEAWWRPTADTVIDWLEAKGM